MREVSERASQVKEIVCAKALGQEGWWHVEGMKWSGAWGVWGRGSERAGLHPASPGPGSLGEDVKD